MDAAQSSQIKDLLTHMEWGDALMWKSVLALPPGHQTGVLLERLHHIHTVQWVYLQMVREEPLRVAELASFADAAGLAAWARQYYEQLRGFAEVINGDALSRILDIPWAAEVARRYGTAAPATLAEGLLQVVLHSTYHRGQVATLVRGAEGEPALTDFIVWVWKGKPEPSW